LKSRTGVDVEYRRAGQVKLPRVASGAVGDWLSSAPFFAPRTATRSAATVYIAEPIAAVPIIELR